VRPPRPRRLLAARGALAGGALLAALLAAWLPLSACYEGRGPLEPPPGSPGGLCLEPQKICDQADWVCEQSGGYCYDPALPCRGVFCGEHGVCQPDKDGLPVCYCDPGYSNAAYSLYCDEL